MILLLLRGKILNSFNTIIEIMLNEKHDNTTNKINEDKFKVVIPQTSPIIHQNDKPAKKKSDRRIAKVIVY